MSASNEVAKGKVWISPSAWRDSRAATCKQQLNLIEDFLRNDWLKAATLNDLPILPSPTLFALHNDTTSIQGIVQHPAKRFCTEPLSFPRSQPFVVRVFENGLARVQTRCITLKSLLDEWGAFWVWNNRFYSANLLVLVSERCFECPVSLL